MQRYCGFISKLSRNSCFYFTLQKLCHILTLTLREYPLSGKMGNGWLFRYFKFMGSRDYKIIMVGMINILGECSLFPTLGMKIAYSNECIQMVSCQMLYFCAFQGLVGLTEVKAFRMLPLNMICLRG